MPHTKLDPQPRRRTWIVAAYLRREDVTRFYRVKARTQDAAVLCVNEHLDTPDGAIHAISAARLKFETTLEATE